MSTSPTVTHLLETAMHEAADVARTRLGRAVSVAPAGTIESTAILRFDLTFATGGRLAWFVSNDDATGFADMLIGGAGDRGAALTEMHLDALTVAFSDMLQRTVDAIGAGCSQPAEAGEIDLGMEGGMPPVDADGAQVALALEIEGFGSLPVVQQVDAQLATWLEAHALATAPAAAMADAAPEPAGPAPATPDATASTPADNVVSIAAHQQAEGGSPLAGASKGDLEMLMNVPLPLTVELGQTHRTVRELVDFSIGSVIELGKLAGDPLDIKVNDRVIARGEVVVIDEEFGVRVTEIVSPDARLRGIG